jgi:FKBP-type peptidyl-prolyl cis-trans isomerase
MNYAMFTKDGKVLDTSVKRGKPVTVPLDQLFAGWRELMYTMKVGGKRRMEIPPPLAGGRDGVQGWIPPSTTLVVEVELVGLNPTVVP